jgi:hypothetical protein
MLLQVEGDNAKMSDAYWLVQALSKHVQKHVSHDGSLTNMLLDDTTPESTLDLRFEFSSSFWEDWKPRAQQASTDLAAAAAILDPRYRHKIRDMPPEDLARGQVFIEQVAMRVLGQEAVAKAKVCVLLGVWVGWHC